MKIGVLGGTFDPIHKGHLNLAREAKRLLALDRVVFVPAYLAPHKTAKAAGITQASLRYSMVREAVRGIPSFEVSPIEINKRRKVYTVETLRALRRRYGKSHQLYFLTGADHLTTLHTWRYLDKILEIAHFVIAARPGFEKKKLPDKMIWLPIRPVEISADALRECLGKNRSAGKWLPPGVAAFIRKKKLYSCVKKK